MSHWFKANRPSTSSSSPARSAASWPTHPAGRVPLRQHDDPRHGRARGAPSTASRKLLYLGSSCIYPRDAPSRSREDAVAHRAAGADQRGLRDRQDRRHQALPGLPPPVRLQLHLGDADQPLRARTTTSTSTSSHVLPALIRKFHDATRQRRPTVEIWGTGIAEREFLHVDDLADACLFLMDHYDDDTPHQRRHRRRRDHPRTGRDGPRHRLPGATSRASTPSKPDGTPRKLLDVTQLKELGWAPTIDLDAGIRSTYQWFLNQTPTSSLRGIDPSVVPQADRAARALDHRHHRAGRLVPGRAPARKGLRGPRHRPPVELDVQHAIASTTSTRTRPRPDRRLFLALRRPRPTRSASDATARADPARRDLPPRARRATCRSASRSPSTRPTSPASARMRLLEAIRAVGGPTRASTRRRRPRCSAQSPPPQNEDTPFHPRSPYARREGVRVLDDGQLPRGVRHVRQSTASSSTTRARAAARRS